MAFLPTFHWPEIDTWLPSAAENVSEKLEYLMSIIITVKTTSFIQHYSISLLKVTSPNSRWNILIDSRKKYHVILKGILTIIMANFLSGSMLAKWQCARGKTKNNSQTKIECWKTIFFIISKIMKNKKISTNK